MAMAELTSHDKKSFPADPDLALDHLMARYGNVVLRTAYFYLGDRHSAEDIAQETFLRAYRHWSDFRGDSSVKTWLTRITINLCRDYAARKMNSEQPTDPLVLHRYTPFDMENEAVKRLESTVVLKALLELPMPFQETLYLFYYQDLSTAEVATALGINEGTVRSRLHRGRESLRKRLGKEGIIDD